MARVIRLAVCEGNDPTVDLTVYGADGDPLSLPGFTVEMFVKADASAADDATGTTKLTVGAGLTLGTTPGTLTAVIPESALAQPGERFWRLDVVDGEGHRSTAMFGPLTIQDV